jgi:hypothetical protein
MPFFIFIVEVVWEMDIFQKRPKAVKKNTTWVTEKRLKQKTSNRIVSKSIVVGITAIFTISYVIYTLSLYNN